MSEKTSDISRFEEKENVSGVNNVKSSVQKSMRNGILAQMPYVRPYIDQILPKKDPLRVAKCSDHIEILVSKDGSFTYFKQRDGYFFPTLRQLHQYPFLLPHMQVDKGAIKFILSGANIMCPGLTSPGAKMSNVPENTVVAIMAEGKQHAVAVGITKLSTEKILSVNKGIGVENIHYLGDGLWHMKHVK